MRWLNLKNNPINDDDKDKLYLIKNEYGNLFFANYKDGVWFTKTNEPIASSEEDPIAGKDATEYFSSYIYYVPINTDILIGDDIKKKITKYKKRAKRYKNWLAKEQLEQEKIFKLLQEYHNDLYVSDHIEEANAVGKCIMLIQSLLIKWRMSYGVKMVDPQKSEEEK